MCIRDSITTWGPTVHAWLTRSANRREFDAYAIQETHVTVDKIEDLEAKLTKEGVKACFTGARRSTRSSAGSCGGTARLMKGHHQATFFRHAARDQVSQATASTLKEKQCDYDMCDWTPVAWHIKGFTLL
eukprot:7618056-Pyramimonas_sp.AAC.1